jgi:hypothetical protein
VLLQISGIAREPRRVGVGFTVMVKLREGPGQSTEPLLKVGVTVIVAVTGVVPVFIGVKVISPIPSSFSPISGLLLVQ